MIQEIQLSAPVYMIAVVTLLALAIDFMTGKNKSAVFNFVLFGLVLTFGSAAYTLTIPQETIAAFDVANSISKGMINFGGYAAYFDMLFTLAGILTMLAARQYNAREYKDYKEFYSLILFAICGMIFISHAANLLMIFIGIEVMTITFYVLSGFFRNREKAMESALKYFLLGSFASGFLLYGIAMIYGATGTLYLNEITNKMMIGDFNSLYLTIGIGLLTVGLGFKVAAFPFHQWAPDVYEGAPTVVTAFMSTAGKAAGLIAFIVLAQAIIPVTGANEILTTNLEKFRTIIAVISAATMLIGNISALTQKSVKRMLAYSSVAHAGYLLMGIVANTPDGRSGIVFYATAYMFMQIGAFLIVSVLERENKYLEISDYVGLSKSNPVIASMMALFMFSLAGIPPMAGFFGKYYLFMAAMDAGYLWLTIVAVISSIISMYFYIGLVLNMFFKESDAEQEKVSTGMAGIALAISTFGVILFGIYPSLIIDLANTIF